MKYEEWDFLNRRGRKRKKCKTGSKTHTMMWKEAFEQCLNRKADENKNKKNKRRRCGDASNNAILLDSTNLPSLSTVSKSSISLSKSISTATMLSTPVSKSTSISSFTNASTQYSTLRNTNNNLECQPCQTTQPPQQQQQTKKKEFIPMVAFP